MSAGDVRLDQPAQVRLFGKGRKTRAVPLMDPTARLLRDHLREHGLDRAEKFQEPVYQNRQGRALTRWAATRGVLVRQTPTPAQERLLPMPSAAKNRSPLWPFASWRTMLDRHSDVDRHLRFPVAT